MQFLSFQYIQNQIINKLGAAKHQNTHLKAKNDSTHYTSFNLKYVRRVLPHQIYLFQAKLELLIEDLSLVKKIDEKEETTTNTAPVQISNVKSKSSINESLDYELKKQWYQLAAIAALGK